MAVLFPFVPVLCHSDWLFHGESCRRLDVVHPGRAWPSSPACTWHCSLHYLIFGVQVARLRGPKLKIRQEALVNPHEWQSAGCGDQSSWYILFEKINWRVSFSEANSATNFTKHRTCRMIKTLLGGINRTLEFLTRMIVWLYDCMIVRLYYCTYVQAAM